MKGKFIIILVFFSLFLNDLAGQENNPISAEDAVVIALENNYQMQIARKQNEISEKNNKWSEAGAFPTVELTALLGNSVIDNRNNPFTFTPGLIANNQLTPGVAANWNIFSGMGVRISKQRLEQLEKQSMGNGIVILENTTHDVLTSYYNAILQKQRLNVLKEVYNFSKKQFEYEEKKSEYGQANRLSVYQLKNQFFTDSLNIMQQKINYDNALRNLMLVMNVSQDEIENENFPLLSDSLTIDITPIDIENVVNEMKANNQNLKNQMINYELQKTNTQQQRSFLYPVVSLQLGATPNYGRFQFLGDAPEGMSGSLNTQQVNYYGNINLRYNLFNNWRDKRAVEVSKIQEEIAVMNVKELEKQLIVNAKNLIQQFKIKNQLVNVASQNVAYSKLAYEIGRDRFELGSINSIELSQLQNAYLNANVDYFDALYQRIDIYLELQKITGKFQLSYSE